MICRFYELLWCPAKALHVIFSLLPKMGHTEEPCEHHLKDVGKNKMGEQGQERQAHEVQGNCSERGFNWGERQHQRPCYKGWGPVFVWGGGVVPLQHLHGCLVWHAIYNTACQQTHAVSKYACGPSCESFEEDWARSPELQGKWLCDYTDGGQRHLRRNECGGCFETKKAEVHKAPLLIWIT